MSKQELGLKVVPDSATHKGMVVTLSDKDIASLTPTANGVELDARKGGTGTLTVESHHGEVTKTIPVNVQEATDLLVDGKLNTGSRYVKDLPVENEAYNYQGNPRHRGVPTALASGMSITKTNNVYKFTVSKIADPYYRPIDWNTDSTVDMPLKRNTAYTIAFDYNTSSNSYLRTRFILNPTTYKFFSGSGRACITVTTGAEGGQYLSFDSTRVKDVNNGSAVLGDWFEISNLSIAKGTYDSLPFYPAPEDYGVVHGQPNLLNGTSDKWKEITFTGYGGASSDKIYLSDVGLAVGDRVSIMSEVDATNSSLPLYAYVFFKNASHSTVYTLDASRVPVGTSGISKGSTIIPDTALYFVVNPIGKGDGTTSITAPYRNTKVIKGTQSAMDEWTPSQADSGLTVVNDGMVPFNSTDYANILAKDQVVRAETKIYGRGASVDLRFDVLKSIETKYPELFTGLTTTADKLTKLLSLIKKVYFVHASRGAGVSFATETKGQPINAVQSAMILPGGNTAWALGQNNLTENFLEVGSVLKDSYISRIETDGSFTFRISTYRNFADASREDGRGLSDGVTPAWVEVKSAQMEVSIQPPEDPNAKPITITVTPS